MRESNKANVAGSPRWRVESFFGHINGDWPHLEAITDPSMAEAELTRVRIEYNTVRLHASIGYVTPDDEHRGRAPAIRRAPEKGLREARQHRIDENRKRKNRDDDDRPEDQP